MGYKKYIWVLPFISFICGYFFISFYTQKQTLTTPHVLGKNLQTGLQLLSQSHLYAQLLSEKIDPDLPEGIIVNQKPAPGKKVKTGQSVLLVVTKQPAPILAPACIGSYLDIIEQQLATDGIKNKTYFLQSVYPQNYCIGQHPCAGKPLKQKRMITYISSGETKPCIMPNLKDRLFCEVKEFLENKDISYTVTHSKEIGADHSCTNCIITDQRPLSGSIIKLDKNFLVRIHLQYVQK